MLVASEVRNLLPNLGTLGLWVLELLAMYATDGRTDRQKQCLLPPSLRGRGYNNEAPFTTGRGHDNEDDEYRCSVHY